MAKSFKKLVEQMPPERRAKIDQMTQKLLVAMPSCNKTVVEVKIELAVNLYAQGRLSIGKARKLAGLSLWEFRQMLAVRRIPPHYEIADLDEEIVTLREMGRL